MGPKIEAGIDFVEQRRRGVHHHLHRARRRAPCAGEAGTHIVAVMILTNARILTFDAANRVLDSGSVEVRADGAIGVVVRSGRALRRRTRWIARGRLLMPALINCHTHLYSTLARGISPPRPPPAEFPGDPEEALVAAGPRAQRRGRLLQRAGRPDRFRQVRRGHADRSPLQPQCLRRQPGPHRARLPRGRPARRPLLRNHRPQRRARRARRHSRERPLHRTRAARRRLVGASFGLHAAFTLSDRTLRRVRGGQPVARRRLPRPRGRGRAAIAGAVSRLCAGSACSTSDARRALRPRHRRASMTALARHGVNVVHNPQSNCNNAVGIAEPAGAVPARRAGGPRLRRLLAAHVGRVQDRVPRAETARRRSARGLRRSLRRGASRTTATSSKKIWGMDLGRIETGARADLMLVDYFPPTPLDRRQPVRPPAVRHRQRAGGFADGERPLGGARRALRQRGRARDRRKSRRAAPKPLGEILKETS